jgi:hypothetical protein
MTVNVTNAALQAGSCPNANFTNAANNISGAVNVTNSVTASCVSVTTQTPSLNKAFNPTVIDAGGTTTLTFTITNPAANNPAQVVGFTDTLPTSLKIAAAPNIGGSCAGGTVTAAAGGSTITVAGKTVPASGVAATNCTVTVDVTNVTGQLNLSCTNNPVAFTNGVANISGLSNLTSAVTQSCVVVNGQTFSISKTASANTLPSNSPLSFSHNRDQQRTGGSQRIDPDRFGGSRFHRVGNQLHGRNQ